MSKYQYLDSEGLKKYHNLSGYTSLPLDIKPGAIDLREHEGTVVSRGTGDYITDIITLDPNRQYEIVINGNLDKAYIALYDTDSVYIKYVDYRSPSYKFILSEIDGPGSETPNTYGSIRIYAHYTADQTDTSELVILKSVHDNATNYVYDLIKENTNLINENTTLINENTSNIIRFHASHDITITGSNPFERGVSTTFTLSNLYLKLGDNYLTPDSYSVKYRTGNEDFTVDGNNVNVEGDVSTILKTLTNSTGSVSVKNITDKITFTYNLDYKGIKFSKSKTINAYYPMYFGSSSEGNILTFDPAQFEKQAIKSTPAGSYSFTVADDQYIYLLVPDDLPPISRITSGGFDIPWEKQDSKAQTPTNADYNVYRSISKVNGGTINIVIYT